MPSLFGLSAGMRRHSAPRNSPLRHTAASVQITVALSILHPKSGGDPDDPSQSLTGHLISEGKTLRSVDDLLRDCVASPGRALAAVPSSARGPDCHYDRCLHRKKG